MAKLKFNNFFSLPLATTVLSGNRVSTVRKVNRWLKTLQLSSTTFLANLFSLWESMLHIIGWLRLFEPRRTWTTFDWEKSLHELKTNRWMLNLNWSTSFWKVIVLTRWPGNHQEAFSSLSVPQKCSIDMILLLWPTWLVRFRQLLVKFAFLHSLRSWE